MTDDLLVVISYLLTVQYVLRRYARDELRDLIQHTVWTRAEGDPDLEAI